MTNTVFKKTVVAVALVATGIALGWGVSQWRTASSHASGTVPTSAETAKADRKVLYWYDPMVPTQKFDKPGKPPYIGSDVDVLGTVHLNDRDVSIVQARSAGFVERVYARAPGDVVAAGAPLADLLLPEWVSAQREFLAVRALKDESLTTAARQRLSLLGMPASLVAQVERTGEPQGRYTVTFPQAGLVAELMVRQGMTVAAGASL